MAHAPHHDLGSFATDDGVTFRVWAPFAQSVSVLVSESFDWRETPLTAEERGIWSGTDAEALPGQSYKYRIVTAKGQQLERNDPRARQLTVSDNGASVIIDPAYDWGDVARPQIPPEKQIIYELHVGTFNRPDASTSGTFATAIEKLDYLRNLGITMIELMPITSMATSNGWGYAPNYIFSVENTYGGRHGMLDFVKACHERGIGVILDVVYNHFYTDTDLWQFDGWSEHDGGGIYFYNDARGITPWGGRPDYGREEVRQFILDNVTMWFTEYRIDGLRVDSTTYMRNINGPDGSPDEAIPEAWTLLQDLTTLARKINPHAALIAEDTSGDASVTAPVTEGGAGFDAQWGLGFPHAIRQSFGLEGPQEDGALAEQLQYRYNDNVFERVIFSDSHDTAANGSVRLNEAVTPGNAASVFARQQTLLASAITLTAPGIPMLLHGQEFMQEGNFNDWQMLDWEKTKQFAGIVLAHQHLAHLRLNTYGNTAGLLGNNISVIHQDADNHIIAYHRWAQGGPLDDVIIIANCSDQRFDSYTLPLPVTGTWQARFNSSWKGYSKDFNETSLAPLTTNEKGEISLTLADYDVVILSQEP